jgi:hypothetical protein
MGFPVKSGAGQIFWRGQQENPMAERSGGLPVR